MPVYVPLLSAVLGADVRRAEESGHHQVGSDFPQLRTADWEHSKQRLAQLLPLEATKNLIVYYLALNNALVLSSTVIVEDEPNEVKLMVRAHILGKETKDLIPMATYIRERCKRLVGDTPDYEYIDDTPEQSTLS